MLGHRDRLLRRGDYIWGSFVKPERVDGYVVGINPGDRSDVLGRFPFSEPSVDDAVHAAVRGARVWRQGTIAQRSAALRKYKENLGRARDYFAALITRETGKPLWESRQEVLASMRAIDLLLEDGVALLEPRVLDAREARSDYRPRGVVGVLSPYIMPLLIPTLHVASSLLAGNTVVFKPSKFTPGVGQGVAELIDRCRIPRGAFNLVQGSGSGIGQRLATHPGIDALLFSGSFSTAMALRRATFERPELPTLLQCGGKGCAIVLDDADLERTAYELVVGAYLTGGQRHNSTGRAIVTRQVFDRLADELTRRVANLNIGYGFDEDVFFGPVISENFRTRYRRYGRTLLARGHTPLIEAQNREVEGRKGFYVEPSLYWTNWQNGHSFLNEEPPGPTLLLYRVEDWEEAVSLHNQLVYRVSTSLFTSADNPQLEEIANRLRTGALNVNRATIGASLRLPSVGLGRASNGVPGGIDLLRFLSTPRAMLLERRPFDATQVVPGVNWDANDPGSDADLTHALIPE